MTTRRYELRAGQGFLICPGLINTYFADEADPWKYVWLEFDGLRVTEYLTYAGLDAAHPIYIPQTPAQGQAVRDTMLYIANHSKASTLHLIGHLFLFLDGLVQSSSTRRTASGGQLRDFYIQEAITYMEQNYQRDLTVEELADVCKLNRSYFSKLFKREMGENLSTYILNTRIEHAKLLLRTTDKKAYEIAEAVGIYDPVYFSKIFKKAVGLKPKEYRERPDAEETERMIKS